MDALQVLLIVVSIPLLAALIVYTVRHVRELDLRIAEYREEQESQTGSVNPYQQMAELYDVEGDGSRKKQHQSRDGCEKQSGSW